MKTIGMSGRQNWFFADGDMPPEGDGALAGHESIVVLNPNQTDAEATLTFYFEPGVRPQSFDTVFPAESVRCIRTSDEGALSGIRIPECVQYAIQICSSVPIVAHYGRLDNRQPNLAYFASSGYSE